MKKFVNYLLKARDLIENGWTKGAMARKENREFCSETNRNAVCFCASGAIRRVTRCEENRRKLFDLLAEQLPQSSSMFGSESQVIDYNDDDNRRKKQIVRLFDKAIASLEK